VKMPPGLEVSLW